MKLKYLLKKAINLQNGYLIGIILVLLLVIGGYFSYALFTVSIEAKGALNIVTGNLYALIESTDLDKNKSIIVSPNDSVTVTLKLVNTNGRKAKINLYYESTSDNIEIGYLEGGDKAPDKLGYVLEKSGTNGSEKTIYVKITNKDNKDNTITFGTSAGLDNAYLAFPNDKKVLNALTGVKVSNILIAYKYDQTNENTKCITGEEPTCQETKCYQSQTVDSCQIGTIVKYKVNDTDYKYFNVINDSGEKLLLQQRENTISNIAWGQQNLTSGPDTIISELEKATENWTNVNDLNYTINDNTLCTKYNICSSSIYTMTKNNVKARLLRIDEAIKIKCSDTEQTCPVFMNNYLTSSTTYGGTDDINDQNSDQNIEGYWLMEAGNRGTAWAIYNTGNIKNSDVNSTNLGARAVVEINKKQD